MGAKPDSPNDELTINALSEDVIDKLASDMKLFLECEPHRLPTVSVGFLLKEFRNFAQINFTHRNVQTLLCEFVKIINQRRSAQDSFATRAIIAFALSRGVNPARFNFSYNLDAPVQKVTHTVAARAAESLRPHRAENAEKKTNALADALLLQFPKISRMALSSLCISVLQSKEVIDVKKALEKLFDGYPFLKTDFDQGRNSLDQTARRFFDLSRDELEKNRQRTIGKLASTK